MLTAIKKYAVCALNREEGCIGERLTEEDGVRPFEGTLLALSDNVSADAREAPGNGWQLNLMNC